MRAMPDGSLVQRSISLALRGVLAPAAALVALAGCGFSWEQPPGDGDGSGGTGSGSSSAGEGASSSTSAATGGGQQDCSVTDDCDACVACADAGPCAALFNACMADAGCATFRERVSSCLAPGCLEAAVANDPIAAEPYLDLAECEACDVCKNACPVLDYVVSCPG